MQYQVQTAGDTALTTTNESTTYSSSLSSSSSCSFKNVTKGSVDVKKDWRP